MRFIVDWEIAPRPSIHRFPSHQAEDIGAIFDVPSGFWVVMRTTGVPQ
jgi:hypothetical protein